MNYLDEIEQELKAKVNSGVVLIDQLLVTGNGNNRFLLCEFKDGKLVLETAKNIEPDNSYRDKAVELLQSKSHLLGNSILLDIEKEYIANGVSF